MGHAANLMKERQAWSRTLLGTTLEGAYRLTRLMGEGGMGAVFEAVHLRMDKPVAVKVMARELSANEEALARFRREVLVTSQLAHPHIVQVSDFGTAPSGEPYLVMEYLQGEDLAERLDRVGRLPVATTIAIINQVASALAATHAKGIVHRDLKPENLFLVSAPGVTDFVKVVDFGISKVKASDERLTRASVMMGTPAYMAPEQATGRVDDIDHRTDQWALACIAWEMLTGEEPFTAKDTPTLLYTIVHGEPPALAAKVAPEVEPVLRRALSKRQSDRFPTVTAFARALAGAVVARTVELATPPPAVARARTTSTSALIRLRTVFGAVLPRRRRSPAGVVGFTVAMGRKMGDLLPRKKRRPRRWLPWVSAAALLCATVTAGLLLMKHPPAVPAAHLRHR
jgi:serine/threonine protein kinase